LQVLFFKIFVGWHKKSAENAGFFGLEQGSTMRFGNFQIINLYVAKCLQTRCCEIIEPKLNDTQCVFYSGRSTTDHISLSSKCLRILWVFQRCLHMLCRPQQVQESFRGVVAYYAWWKVERGDWCTD